MYSHDMRDVSTPRVKTLPDHNKTGPVKNPLLASVSLGTVKPTCYRLPSEHNLQHQYGLANEPDGSCADDCIASWQIHDSTDSKKPGRDFVETNKQAAMCGAVDARDFKSYTAHHDFRIKPKSDTVVVKKPYDSTTTFGKPGQQAESMNNIISHNYRYDWVAAQSSQTTAGKVGISMKDTKTSKLMQEAAKAKLARMDNPEQKPLWKLPAFKHVPSKIQDR